MGLEAKVLNGKTGFRETGGVRFHKDKEGYHYSQLFMDGDFRADISISLKGTFSDAFSIRRRERSIFRPCAVSDGGLCEYGQGPLCGNIGNDRCRMFY